MCCCPPLPLSLIHISFLSDKEKERFKEEKPVIGKCPRCGANIYEGRKNYYCANRDCAFAMWKNDRFFEERKVTFSPKIAAALLKDGKAKVKKLYSPKTGKTYDGTILLADTGGKYVNYRIAIQRDREAVSYTHLDVYKRQLQSSSTFPRSR